MTDSPRCPGPTTRRSFLQAGALGFGGMGLADLMRAREAIGAPTLEPDTSVIFIWLPGGPPHMETYDMKPADYSGIFRPINSNVSGIDV